MRLGLGLSLVSAGGTGSAPSPSENPQLVTADLALDLNPETGLTHTGDGTEITAGPAGLLAGNTGNGGPLYRASNVQFDGPVIEFGANQWMYTENAGVLAAAAGTNTPFTVYALAAPFANTSSNRYWWSWGQTAQNHYIQAQGRNQLMRIRGAMTGSGNDRTATNYSQWTRAPHACVFSWTFTGSTIEPRVDGRLLTLDSDVFDSLNFDPERFVIAALQDVGDPSLHGLFFLRRFLVYSGAHNNLTRQATERYLAYFGKIPKAGWTLAEMEAAA